MDAETMRRELLEYALSLPEAHLAHAGGEDVAKVCRLHDVRLHLRAITADRNESRSVSGVVMPGVGVPSRQPAMTKPLQPTTERIRCPACRSTSWVRLGERVSAEGDEHGDGRLRYEQLNENDPFDWTCQRCGYSVPPGTRLDHLISKVP